MLKLISYNIECWLQEEKLKQNIQKWAKEGVNIFCLQEVRTVQNKPSFADALLKLLGPNWKAEYYSDPEFDSVGLALCTLWNSTVLNYQQSEKFLLPLVGKLNWWEWNLSLIIRGHLEKNSWFAFLTHKLEQLSLKRGALVCTFNFGTSQLRVVNTHLDWAQGPKQRLSQVSYIASYLNSQPKVDYEIICGDFNTLGSLFNFKERSEQVRKLLPQGFYDSLNPIEITAKLFMRLDYVFVKGFKKYKAIVLPLSASDHKPLLAELE